MGFSFLKGFWRIHVEPEFAGYLSGFGAALACEMAKAIGEAVQAIGGGQFQALEKT
jgi:hypothetical protein